jgi:hypothetical protein
MVEQLRWVMVASKRIDATAADRPGSNRGAPWQRRLAGRGRQ